MKTIFLLFLGGLLHAAEAPHFWTELDVVYLTATEEGVVVTNQYSPVLSTSDFTQAPLTNPSFEWDFGFCARAGFWISSEWNTELNWTFWQGGASQNTTTDANEVNQLGSYPIWNLAPDAIAGDHVSDSSLDWDLGINRLNLAFNYTENINRWLRVRPFAGIESVWTDQHFEAVYSGGIFIVTFSSPGVSVSGSEIIAMKDAFWGLGPKLGCEFDFPLRKGLELYAIVSGSSLPGYDRLKQTGEYLGNTLFDLQSAPFQWRWVVDASAGLGYETPLYENRYWLSLKFGYEMHDFIRLLRLHTDPFGIAPQNTSLILQGVSWRSRIDF